MNTVIYLNNFRGFKETIIPFRQVNFLVGENSTGKTSVLSILSLLFTQEFWTSLDFNSGQYEFGGYQDLVSNDSEDKSEFQIGILKFIKNEQFFSYVLHFQEDKRGLPKLVRLSHAGNDYFTSVNITENQVKIYFDKLEKKFNFGHFEYINDVFEFLLKIPKEIKRGYRVLQKDKTDLYKENPVFFLPLAISETYPNAKKFVTFKNVTSFTDANFANLAPIRTKPKRTYDGYTQQFNSEGLHTPYILKEKLNNKSEKNFRLMLEKFGKSSGLFKSLNINEYGTGKAVPFELIVSLSEKSALRINSVGYGMSQVLPVVVELLNRPSRSLFSIQQPEVHLHPKAQAALGDLFFSAAHDKEKVLFIETHSEFLIDRFRLNFKRTEKDDKFSQILFFERSNVGNKISFIELDEHGEFSEEQPDSFRAFFLEEQKALLGF